MISLFAVPETEVWRVDNVRYLELLYVSHCDQRGRCGISQAVGRVY